MNGSTDKISSLQMSKITVTSIRCTRASAENKFWTKAYAAAVLLQDTQLRRVIIILHWWIISRFCCWWDGSGAGINIGKTYCMDFRTSFSFPLLIPSVISHVSRDQTNWASMWALSNKWLVSIRNESIEEKLTFLENGRMHTDLNAKFLIYFIIKDTLQESGKKNLWNFPYLFWIMLNY